MIAARAEELLSAGADHLAIQVVTGDPRQDLPREKWRRLAAVLPIAA